MVHVAVKVLIGLENGKEISQNVNRYSTRTFAVVPAHLSSYTDIPLIFAKETRQTRRGNTL